MMSKEITVRHVPSEGFRTAIVDNATSIIVGDPFGAQIYLTLTRMAGLSISEQVRIEDNGVLNTLPTPPLSENVRMLEFTAALRPNHAKNLISAIQGALRAMSPEARKQYGITDADLGPAP